MMTARSQLIYICTTHLRCVSLERHELHFAFPTLNGMKHGPSCSAHHISALPSIQCFQVCFSCSEMLLGITTVSSLLCILNPTIWEPKKRRICGIPVVAHSEFPVKLFGSCPGLIDLHCTKWVSKTTILAVSRTILQWFKWQNWEQCNGDLGLAVSGRILQWTIKNLHWVSTVNPNSECLEVVTEKG